MTESQACLAFNLVDGVGAVKVEQLKAMAGSLVAAWERYPNKIARNGLEVDWEAEIRLAKNYGVEIVTQADEQYPTILKDERGAPLVLYVKGNVEALSKMSLAIVGTRRSTTYGRSIANRLAYDLAKADIAIVSGLALGIDAEAHRGALEAGGITIGIIGSGLDEFYPVENRELAREIVKKGGAVVSQFPFGRKPDKETFPIRNHIVAALSRGTIAIESPLKSGTLITTTLAAELGRTVMAVPGRIDSAMSAGCLELIRQGATLVRHVDDVLEAISELFPRREMQKLHRDACDESLPKYSAEEALVMLHVDETGISMDDLAEKTGFDVMKVNAIAMTLRVRGFIRFLPGNRIATIMPR